MSLESRLKEEVSSYYENNDLGHKLSHVNNVIALAFNIKDMLKLDHPSLRDDLIIIACYYHDMYSSSNREKHAIEASEYVMKYSRDIDSVCNDLSEEDRLYVAHAVLEHRASYKGEYSSPLSELLSAADRGLPSAVDILERVLKCTEDKNCIVKVEVADVDTIDKAVYHLRDKFSSTGYARYNKMYQQAYPIGLYTLQRCFDNITKEHVNRVLITGMEKIRLLSNKEFYKFLYNDELFPVVKLTQLTSLENCDRAIGKCWNKQSEDGVNFERMDRVVNKNKHESTSEHIVAGFDISDVTRLLLMEHTRHRIASISVKSTRYTLKELKEETEPFYDETVFHYQRARKYIKLTHNVKVNRAAIRGLEEVRLLVHDGISNDVIKYALPESFLTEFEWTINFRSLKNYLKLRTDKSSHFEIRNLAYAIYDVIPKEYRFLLKDALYVK